MKLYTKQGDDGKTGLLGGGRVPKDDLRVSAYGEVDEANAAIGLALVGCKAGVISDRLRRIQGELFTLGAELATAEGNASKVVVGGAHIARLEAWIDDASKQTPPLKQFILPGGSETAARLHLARTVCRRAERAVVTLSQAQQVRHEAIIYLNRLSDLLFALARLANHEAGVVDVEWSPPVTDA